MHYVLLMWHALVHTMLRAEARNSDQAWEALILVARAADWLADGCVQGGCLVCVLKHDGDGCIQQSYITAAYFTLFFR